MRDWTLSRIVWVADRGFASEKNGRSCNKAAGTTSSVRSCALAPMKPRPVYHRREDRIRAHILLCWLALLLIRIAETSTGHTWAKIRTEIERLHVGVFTGAAGTFRQRTELSQPQKAILAKPSIAEPPRIIDATPAPR